MATFVDITDIIGLTKLTFEPSLYVGCEVYFFLEEIELPLAHSFTPSFISLPDAFYGSINEHITEDQHREAND